MTSGALLAHRSLAATSQLGMLSVVHPLDGGRWLRDVAGLSACGGPPVASGSLFSSLGLVAEDFLGYGASSQRGRSVVAAAMHVLSFSAPSPTKGVVAVLLMVLARPPSERRSGCPTRGARSVGFSPTPFGRPASSRAGDAGRVEHGAELSSCSSRPFCGASGSSGASSSSPPARTVASRSSASRWARCDGRGPRALLTCRFFPPARAAEGQPPVSALADGSPHHRPMELRQRGGDGERSRSPQVGRAGDVARHAEVDALPHVGGPTP